MDSALRELKGDEEEHAVDLLVDLSDTTPSSSVTRYTCTDIDFIGEIQYKAFINNEEWNKGTMNWIEFDEIFSN